MTQVLDPLLLLRAVLTRAAPQLHALSGRIAIGVREDSASTRWCVVALGPRFETRIVETEPEDVAAWILLSGFDAERWALGLDVGGASLRGDRTMLTAFGDALSRRPLRIYERG